MNAKQTRKLRAHVTTEGLLKGSAEANAIPGMPAKVAVLSAKIGEIDTLAITQTQPIEAKTARRDELLVAMKEGALDVANALAAHAEEHHLTELAVLAEVSEATFAALRISHRPWLAQRLLDAARAIVPPLTGPGMTAERLTAVQAAIHDLKAGLDQPRGTIAEKRAATARMAVAFDEIDELFDGQIDRLVFPLRKTNPAFFALYQATRAVDASPSARDTKPEVASVAAANVASAAATVGEPANRAAA